MLDALQQTWQSNKTRVILLAIPVVVIVIAALFLKGYRTYLLGAAAHILTGAKAQDDQLKTAQTTAEAQAQVAQQQATELGKKADDVEQGAGDPDWNKKQ